jgi:putative effector of murein hydrolase LrgA (UPF0299 family)
MKSTCERCGGELATIANSPRSVAGILLALVVLAIGVASILMVPIYGRIAGTLLCLLALFMASRRRKDWKCRKCGWIV